MDNNYFDFLGQNSVAGNDNTNAGGSNDKGKVNLTVRVDADCQVVCDGDFLFLANANQIVKDKAPMGQHLLNFTSLDYPEATIEKIVDFPVEGNNYLIVVNELKEKVEQFQKGKETEKQEKLRAAEEERLRQEQEQKRNMELDAAMTFYNEEKFESACELFEKYFDYLGSDQQNIFEDCKNKSEWKVILKDSGNNKIEVVKLLEKKTLMPLKNAKDSVDSTPVVILETTDRPHAELVKKLLEEIGATIGVCFLNSAEKENIIERRKAENRIKAELDKAYQFHLDGQSEVAKSMFEKNIPIFENVMVKDVRNYDFLKYSYNELGYCEKAIAKKQDCERTKMGIIFELQMAVKLYDEGGTVYDEWKAKTDTTDLRFIDYNDKSFVDNTEEMLVKIVDNCERAKELLEKNMPKLRDHKDIKIPIPSEPGHVYKQEYFTRVFEDCKTKIPKYRSYCIELKENRKMRETIVSELQMVDKLDGEANSENWPDKQELSSYRVCNIRLGKYKQLKVLLEKNIPLCDKMGIIEVPIPSKPGYVYKREHYIRVLDECNRMISGLEELLLNR